MYIKLRSIMIAEGYGDSTNRMKAKLEKVLILKPKSTTRLNFLGSNAKDIGSCTILRPSHHSLRSTSILSPHPSPLHVNNRKMMPVSKDSLLHIIYLA